MERFFLLLAIGVLSAVCAAIITTVFPFMPVLPTMVVIALILVLVSMR